MNHNDLTQIIEAQTKILCALESLSEQDPERKPTLGEWTADGAVRILGSWKFVLTQAIFLVSWIILTVLGFVNFEPYP